MTQPFKRRLQRVAVFLLAALPLSFLGLLLGRVAAYHLGDHGDVASAFISVVTFPLGAILGLVGAISIALAVVKDRST